MTASSQENQVQNQEKNNDKEYNFRAIEATLRQERAARIEAEKRAEELLKKAQEIRSPVHEEEEDDEPYVAPKKLEKKLNKFSENTQSEIQKAMEIAKQQAKEELKQELWLEKNSDFYDVLKHADKFAENSPQLADTILRMPEGFERKKLVYQNIKALGLHNPEPKQPSIQDKIDANRRSPYYQPSGIAASPYAASSDFSPAGQKQAYEKMKQLQAQLKG